MCVTPFSGDVITGSNDVTKLVRVRNEGPIGAQVNWVVREPGDEGVDDRLVTVDLNTSDGTRDSPVDVKIKWKEVKPYEPPYVVEPRSTIIKPHSDTTFSVRLLSQMVSEGGKGGVAAMMSLDAEWLPKNQSSSVVESSTSPVMSQTQSLHGGVMEGSTADGKGRGGGSVESLASTKVSGSGGLDKQTLGAVKVLLTAQPITPRLMLDKQVHSDKKNKQFLKFTAYSTRHKSAKTPGGPRV